MDLKLFRMERRRMVDWGDYGDILQHGMGMVLPRRDGRMILLRTGPFIPPITVPGLPFDPRGSGIVVANSARTALEGSGLTGLTFQPVLKGRVVWLPWHEWDLKAPKARQYPSTGTEIPVLAS